ncbi:hypothetical protein QJS66_13850 [Kocuria rhizophila]|nr:hypothetical protein QJS66_13850 [Kocuria rhizophila]
MATGSDPAPGWASRVTVRWAWPGAWWWLAAHAARRGRGGARASRRPRDRDGAPWPIFLFMVAHVSPDLHALPPPEGGPPRQPRLGRGHHPRTRRLPPLRYPGGHPLMIAEMAILARPCSWPAGFGAGLPALFTAGITLRSCATPDPAPTARPAGTPWRSPGRYSALRSCSPRC